MLKESCHETNKILDEFWDDYSSRFNLLSDKMSSAGIDIKLLTDLLKAYENFSVTKAALSH